jgi:hypothetical protein
LTADVDVTVLLPASRSIDMLIEATQRCGFDVAAVLRSAFGVLVVYQGRLPTCPP